MKTDRATRALHLRRCCPTIRFLVVISGAGTDARGSFEGQLGCCAVRDNITAALKAMKIDMPPEDSSDVCDYSDGLQAVRTRMRTREREARR